jgi:predicted permease
VHPAPEFTGQRGIDLYRRTVADLAALSGVRSATMSSGELLHGEGHARFSVPGYVPKPDEILTANDTGVGPGFFATTGIRLLRGRDFDARDFAAGLPKVAVINETMARHFFGESDPTGQRFKHGPQLFEIIGVARDLKYYDHLNRPTPFAIYRPFAQDPAEAQSMTFLIRTSAEPRAMATTVTKLIRRIEPTLRIADVHTMDSWIDRQLVRERALAHLSGSFSIFAVMLASFGLYGLLSYGVARRTREIGVRMALGARPANVLRMFLRESLTLLLTGIALGIAGAAGSVRLVTNLLYGTSPTNASQYATVGALMILVGLLATLLPARRAAKIDPMVALRAE